MQSISSNGSSLTDLNITHLVDLRGTELGSRILRNFLSQDIFLALDIIVIIMPDKNVFILHSRNRLSKNDILKKHFIHIKRSKNINLDIDSLHGLKCKNFVFDATC